MAGPHPSRTPGTGTPGTRKPRSRNPGSRTPRTRTRIPHTHTRNSAGAAQPNREGKCW